METPEQECKRRLIVEPQPEKMEELCKYLSADQDTESLDTSSYHIMKIIVWVTKVPGKEHVLDYFKTKGLVKDYDYDVPLSFA